MDQFRVTAEYKRATNSEFLGHVVYFIEEYFIKSDEFDWEEMKPGIVKDFLTYTFVLSVSWFVLYYLRSKRMDDLHKSELAKAIEKKRLQKL